MYLNNFYELHSIEPNSKKHQNIQKVRIQVDRTNLVRFDLERLGSERNGLTNEENCEVSLYPTAVKKIDGDF